MKISILGALLVTLATSAAAHAQAYTINATSCVADSSAIQGNLYFGTGGTVPFQTGETGDIVLYCPIPFELSFTPGSLLITYYDDSAVAGNHVTAQLIKMQVTNGALTTVDTVDSDSGSASSGGNANFLATDFSDTYSPDDYAYYIRVDIIRNTTAADEKLYAVQVEAHP